MLYKLNKVNLGKLYKFKRNHELVVKRIKKNLVFGTFNKVGRNLYGRITVFTKGYGFLKSKVRVLDFKRVLVSKGLIISVEKEGMSLIYVAYFLIVYSLSAICTITALSVAYKQIVQEHDKI